MTIWAVLATGPSMNKELTEIVRGKVKVLAVSDAYKLAPWADGLVSHDRSWWREHPKALRFKGRKFCRFHKHGTEIFNTNIPSACNSGYMAMNIAASKEVWGKHAATKILMLGFDMHGTHFFGPHPPQLKNTSEKRRRVHIDQFRQWNGCEVINCTPGSKIPWFPIQDIKGLINGI